MCIVITAQNDWRDVRRFQVAMHHNCHRFWCFCYKMATHRYTVVTCNGCDGYSYTRGVLTSQRRLPRRTANVSQIRLSVTLFRTTDRTIIHSVFCWECFILRRSPDVTAAAGRRGIPAKSQSPDEKRDFRPFCFFVIDFVSIFS